jgi:RHS repeat-associated protein
LQSGPLDLTYTYFPNGNVDSIDDTRSGYDSSYSYDALDRLTGVSGYGYSSYEYDDLGNRTSKSLSAGSVTYSYNSTTKRLTSASTSMGAPESGTFTYDDVGNMTGDGTETYAYSSRNMMTTSTLTSTSASTRYQYDAEGVRALKSGPSGPSYYIHGPGGLLLAEYAGSFSKESPWAATTGLAPDLRLTWSAVASATYEVCVDQVDDDACNASWVSTSSATYKDLTALPAGTYFWQVRETTTGSPVEADAGHWWSFTVNAEGVFGKTSPGSGATVLTDDVTLAWAALPDVGYYVCWDTTNNNTCDGSWMPNGASTSRLLESLAAGTYYWQVKAWNGSAYTEADAGVWWSFTKVTTASGKLAPTSGTAGLGTDVWLSWAAAGDVAYYVCWDTTDNDTCDDTWHTNGGSTTRLLEGLSAGTYYWQVKVWDGSAYTEMNGGVWWHFTVGAAAAPGSGTATVTREYVYLGSRLLASIESGTTTTYYHQDVLGSVRAITSSAGSTVNRIDYFPFGENTASLSGDPRKFLGQEEDAETAFDYLGARYYRNVWGRFTGVDPIFSPEASANPQLWNRYAYSLNSPLRYSDPTGMAASDNDDRLAGADTVGPNCTFSCQSDDDFMDFYFNASVSRSYSTWIQNGRMSIAQEIERSSLFRLVSAILWLMSGMGQKEWEPTAFIREIGGYTQFVIPVQSYEPGRYRGDKPNGAFAMIHVHPNSVNRAPFKGDDDNSWASKNNLDIYTISRFGLAEHKRDTRDFVQGANSLEFLTQGMVLLGAFQTAAMSMMLGGR